MIVPVVMYGIAAYVSDVVIRPEVVARAARTAARRRGKPFLNVGAGTPGSSLRVLALGPTYWGDVNCDLAGTGEPRGRLRRSHVYFADVHDLPFRDKQFGAVIASHVIEHVEDPEVAMRELARVADEVYVITPKWWAPHTWLHPGHRWYRDDAGRFRTMRAGGPRAARRRVTTPRAAQRRRRRRSA